MRFKRLRHVVNTLAQMTCGPLAAGDRELLRLGSGRLSVDALLPSCTFAGARLRRMPPLVWTLHQWLVRDLQQGGITVAALRGCRLEIDLEVTASGELLRVACSCAVSTPDASYSAQQAFAAAGAEGPTEPGPAPDPAA